MADWNQDSDTTLIGKGYAQIYDGGTPFRFKKMFEITIISQADSSKSYNDTLQKRKAIIGDSSTVEMRTKKTPDLFDTADPPTDEKTASWFIHKVNVLREMPEIDFEMITQSESSVNAFVTTRGIYYAETVREERRGSDGEYDYVISGELKTMTTPGHRTNSV